MIFTDMEKALMEGGHSLEGYTKPKSMQFIRELKEARLIKDKSDIKFSYSEVCEHLYLVILALAFISRLKQGEKIAKKYADQTASYINYNEFKTNATDLYNLIYFVQEKPEFIEKIFSSGDAKKLREKTHLPRMELNRWLLKIDQSESRDMYFLMRLEQALNITNSEGKDIRRMLSYKNPTSQDLSLISARLLNAFRQKTPLLDLRQDLEQILSGGKYTYIG
jgi:hypothetical protein